MTALEASSPAERAFDCGKEKKKSPKGGEGWGVGRKQKGLNYLRLPPTDNARSTGILLGLELGFLNS